MEYLIQKTINPHQYHNESTTMNDRSTARLGSLKGKTHGFSIFKTEEIELEPISKVHPEHLEKVEQQG